MNKITRALGLATLALGIGWAQTPAKTLLTLDQPDAQRVKEELSTLLDHYPPSLRGVLAFDPNVLGNQAYLASYPALASFVQAHPEVARNPAFYIGDAPPPHFRQDASTQIMDMWRQVLDGLGVFAGFAMGIGLLVWLIRTLADYKRWSRLAKVQTEAHTKLLDRFTANEDLLAYVQSPAGSRFLQSAPIALDAAPRSMGAPMSRILWSVQGGVVLIAGGIGMTIVSGRVSEPASQSLQALGILGIALGIGFAISAVVSYLISQRLGLLEPPSPAARVDLPGVQ